MKRKRKKVFKKTFKIISCIIGFLGVTLINMPFICFMIILLIGIIFLFGCIIYLAIVKIIKKSWISENTKVKGKIKKLNEKLHKAENADKQCEFIEKLCKNDSKLKAIKENIKQCDILRIKIINKIKISMCVILCFCICNTSNFSNILSQSLYVLDNSFAAKKADVPIINSIKRIQSTASNEENKNEYNNLTNDNVNNDNNDNIDGIDNVITSATEGNWIRFKLESSTINNNEYDFLYKSIFYIGEENIKEVVKSNITIWVNCNKINMALENATTESGNSTEFYTNIEKDFSYKNEKNLTSELWDVLIEGRKELFESYPNATLAWLLANNYQTYALNYLEQTNNEKSILYFYMKSIEYTQKSLEFEVNEEMKIDQIKYLQSRYKDITECDIINKDIRLKASSIYMAIQEFLDELQISK